VLVVSRYAQFLGAEHNVDAKLRLLWCHDIWAQGATNALLLRADKILALSQWHKDFLVKHHNLHPDHVVVTRNGIDPADFEQKRRRRHSVYNSSSPDRSWPMLLEVWPRIRQQVSDARLDLFYGFDNMAKDPQFAPLITHLRAAINQPGVFFHGRVPESKMLGWIRTAEVWAYGTWFDETSCISAMQARAAGCHIVTSNRAALPETLAGYDKAVLLDGEWTSPEYKDAFVKAVVAAMRAHDRPEPRDAGQGLGDPFSKGAVLDRLLGPVSANGSLFQAPEPDWSLEAQSRVRT
jgi:glycosyltransferase involved in cell wall biosynthesis